METLLHFVLDWESPFPRGEVEGSGFSVAFAILPVLVVQGMLSHFWIYALLSVSCVNYVLCQTVSCTVCFTLYLNVLIAVVFVYVA